MLSKLITLSALLGSGMAKSLYDTQRSDVTVYSRLNFEKQVTKNRDKGISIVHFYKKGDGQSPSIKPEYEAFATDNKGIFRIGALDCVEFEALCTKEGVTGLPAIRIYPTFPAPTQDLKLGEKFEAKQLKKAAGRFYTDKSIEITGNNHSTFVEEDVATPKVLLFTNAQKGTPFVYKALSQNFQKTLQFGLVRESEQALAQKYKVKKFPALFVLKSEGKPLKFEGDKFTYSDIFEFLNVHSQIFVDPNSKDNTPKTSSAAKPWLVSPVPQVTKDSGNDICLKKDGSLCIILVNKDKAALDQAHLDAMYNVNQQFTSKISRGIQFIFSHIDASAEPEFAKVLAAPDQHDKFPRLIVLNPGKRKRILSHEGDIDENSITKTLDKILAGDAKFKIVKGNKLPDLVSEWIV